MLAGVVPKQGANPGEAAPRASAEEGYVIMVANRHSRIGHRLLLKMGLRKSGFNAKFDESHHRYTYLVAYVQELQYALSAYALQVR